MRNDNDFLSMVSLFMFRSCWACFLDWVISKAPPTWKIVVDAYIYIRVLVRCLFLDRQRCRGSSVSAFSPYTRQVDCISVTGCHARQFSVSVPMPNLYCYRRLLDVVLLSCQIRVWQKEWTLRLGHLLSVYLVVVLDGLWETGCVFLARCVSEYIGVHVDTPKWMY